MEKSFLPPATKLWQGNIFTAVCQSFCSRGVVSVQGGLCLGGLCPGYLCLGGVSGGVSVRGGGSLLGRHPPYSNERAVRILLECILVNISFSFCIFPGYMSRVTVHNKQRLVDFVENRPAGRSLVTVANHYSCLDDPLVWGMLPQPIITKVERPILVKLKYFKIL